MIDPIKYILDLTEGLGDIQVVMAMFIIAGAIRFIELITGMKLTSSDNDRSNT